MPGDSRMPPYHPPRVEGPTARSQSCTDARCYQRGQSHHGPCATSASERARRWTGPASPAHVDGCAGCGEVEEEEVARLAAGGALRPGQRAPSWLTAPERVLCPACCSSVLVVGEHVAPHTHGAFGDWQPCHGSDRPLAWWAQAAEQKEAGR
jgi:hypothetical protein